MRPALLVLPLLLLAGCSRKVLVTSEPPGAEIFLDGQPTGLRTPAEVLITQKDRKQKLNLRLAGFLEASVRPEETSFCCMPCLVPSACCMFICTIGELPSSEDPFLGKASSFVCSDECWMKDIPSKIHMVLTPETSKP